MASHFGPGNPRREPLKLMSEKYRHQNSEEQPHSRRIWRNAFTTPLRVVYILQFRIRREECAEDASRHYQLSKSHSTLLLSSGVSADREMKSLGWIFSSLVEVSSFSASTSPSRTILSPLTTYKPRGTSQYFPNHMVRKEWVSWHSRSSFTVR